MKPRQNPLRLFLFASLLLCLLTGLTGIARSPEKVDAAPQMQGVTHIVISQVYGGGGNANATYLNDYVELFNPTNGTLPLDGWSIQYASPTGTGLFSANVVNLSGSLSAGRYYLVQLASGGAIGNTLPISDATGSIDMGATNGKLVLVSTTTGLSCNGGSTPCTPSDLANIVDLVGYGSANFYEGSNASPAISNSTSGFRSDNGCIDTDNNGADFSTGVPNPRNTASPAFSCTRVTDVKSSTADGTYSSTSVPNTIDIKVTFSNAVSIDTAAGTPTLLLETGSTDRPATYDAANSTPDTLAFIYTIMPEDSSSDLDYVSTNALSLNGATITDAVGPVNLTLPSPGSPGSLGANQSIRIDAGGPPSVTVEQAGGQADPTSTSPINFTVVFSEAVTGFTDTTVTLSGTAGATTAAVSGGPITYNVAVSGMTTSGTVIVSIPASVVTDLDGNSNSASTSTDNNVTFASLQPSVVISEFRTKGPDGANDEYIELYNPTSAVVDISGWKINVSNDEGSTSTRATIPASTILRSGQYYLIANTNSNGGYSNSNVLPNLTYGTGISDNGGIALLKADNTPVDRVGLSAGSAYKEGTHVSLSPSANQSYERKAGGASDSCVDTNDNANDFIVNSSDPKNYSSQLSRCGTLLPIPVVTTTTITADTPDPSLVNANVSLTVKVTGGSTTPSGIVNITGSNSNCSITLNSSGTGSCTVRFTSTGTKTLTAKYVGDQTHLASSDTESHQVVTVIRTPTATRPPTAVPPPPLVAINEFVPRPGHDWNNDGEVNVRDEYVEIINHGTINVNLSGYSLDDEANIGSAPYRLPAVTIRPGERLVFYGSETGLLLSDGGDGVRLLKPNGQLMDAYNYTVARYSDQSYCRLPDDGGLDDWNQNCYPTPGLQNSLSGGFVPPSSGSEQLLCPIADTLPEDFVIAECAPYGNNIWRREFWDAEGWYNEKIIPGIQSRWDVFAD